MPNQKLSQPKNHSGTSREKKVSPPDEAMLTATREISEPDATVPAEQLRSATPGDAPLPEPIIARTEPTESMATTDGGTEIIAGEQPVDTINTDPEYITQQATNEPNAAATETGLVTQFPELHLSTSELAFAKTAVGKPIFMVFTIAQQNINTPVTITSDEPTHVQVASDSRPAFKPMLTLTPSPTGTFVHVRFAPVKAGQIDGHLIIETPYTTKFLAVTGRGAGLIPALRVAPAPGQPPLRPPVRSRSLIGGFALTTLLVAGLAMAGYTFRCQLMPSLCDEVADSPAVSAEPMNLPAPSPVAESDDVIITTRPRSTNPVATVKSPGSERIRSQSETTDESTVDEEAVDPLTTDEPVGDAPVKKQTAEKADKTDKVEESVGSPAVTAAAVAPVAQKAVPKSSDAPPAKVALPDKVLEPAAAPTGESELERELNTKKPKNQ